jgi:hypothetical protein
MGTRNLSKTTEKSSSSPRAAGVFVPYQSKSALTYDFFGDCRFCCELGEQAIEGVVAGRDASGAFLAKAGHSGGVRLTMMQERNVNICISTIYH